MRIGLGGARKSEPRQISGIDELFGKSNYFIGNDPTKWHIGVPLYSKVAYENIYPGIDLIFHGTQQNLEFDFIVGPHADPRLINLQFDKQENVWIDKRGNLVLAHQRRTSCTSSAGLPREFGAGRPESARRRLHT